MQQQGNRLEPAAVRHHHVEQDDVRLRAARFEDGFTAGGGLAGDLDALRLVEQQAQARSDDRVVVDDQDASRRRHGSTLILPAGSAYAVIRKSSVPHAEDARFSPSYRGPMRSTFPVLWLFNDVLATGRLDIEDGRLTLTARDRSFSSPVSGVGDHVIERGPARRIRGLPALTLDLADGVQVRLASLGGAGSLQEISSLVGGPGFSAPVTAPALRSSSRSRATTRL